MTASAWLFVGVVAAIALSIPLLEHWQRRIDEADRQRRREHHEHMVEVKRQPQLDTLGRIEPTEPRRRP